jgi:hypothetical protein
MEHDPGPALLTKVEVADFDLDDRIAHLNDLDEYLWPIVVWFSSGARPSCGPSYTSARTDVSVLVCVLAPHHPTRRLPAAYGTT